MLSASLTFGQWSSVPVGTTQNLLSVNYHSTNDIWIGGSNLVGLTNNNASSWTFYDTISSPTGLALSAVLFDLEVTSPSSALLAGPINFGTVEIILSTTNSAANWNIIYSNTTGQMPMQFNAFDSNSSVYLAVGNNGHVLKSTPSSTNWFDVYTGIGDKLNDVRFINSTNVIAGGDHKIILSNDAGQSWLPVNFHSEIKSISCPANSIYLGTTDHDTIYKSTNGGTSFTGIPVPFESTGVLYAISTDTVMVSGTDGLYVTHDGGLFWEKYVTPGYRVIRMFDFLNSQQGFAVGDSGYVIRTNNLSQCPSVPISRFSISANTNCFGDTILLNNETINRPGYNYNWQVNGTTISTQFNTTYILADTGLINITLTVTNQNGPSIITKQIYVFGHAVGSFSLLASDTVCSGDLVSFLVPNSQQGASYTIRLGNSIVGNPVVGNGDSITLQTPQGILATTTYEIVSVFTNACFSDSISQTKIIRVGSGVLKSACVPSTNGFELITEVNFSTIHNTTLIPDDRFIDYSCYKNTDLFTGYFYPMNIKTTGYGYLSAWIDYDSSGTFTTAEELFTSQVTQGNLTYQVHIPVLNFVYNTPLRLRILFKASWGGNDPCSANSPYDGEDYSVTIRHTTVPPTTVFAYSTSVTCTTDVTFSNTTLNADNYYWDFGDGDTSTLTNPVHSYDTSGIYSVTLISGNIYGNDTLTKLLTIQNPLLPDTTCEPTPYPFSCNQVYFKNHEIQGPYISSFSIPAQYNGSFKSDFTCTHQVHLRAGSQYNFFTAACDVGTTNYDGIWNVWFDWNNDGTLGQNEVIPGGNPSGGTSPISFTIPVTAVSNAPLRARIVCSGNSNLSPCGSICGMFADFTVFVDLGGTTDVMSLASSQNMVSIYPNPGSGLFTIESSGGEIEIYSFTGALACRKKIDSGIQQLLLDDLVDGCYHLSLLTGISRVEKTLIIMRK